MEFNLLEHSILLYADARLLVVLLATMQAPSKTGNVKLELYFFHFFHLDFKRFHLILMAKFAQPFSQFFHFFF